MLALTSVRILLLPSGGAHISSITAGWLFLGLFAAFSFLLLWALFARRDTRKRREGLERFARESGFSYEPQSGLPDAESALLMVTNGAPLVAHAWHNVMRRTSATCELIIFDDVWLRGKTQQRSTCALAHCPSIQLPKFTISPAGIATSGNGGMKTVEYPDHMRFSKRFRVAATDERAVRNLFDPNLLRAFDDLPSSPAELSVQAEGEWVAVRPGVQLVPVEQMRGFVDAANAIAAALHQAAHNSPLSMP